jgi:hypothetical protein
MIRLPSFADYLLIADRENLLLFETAQAIVLESTLIIQ